MEGLWRHENEDGTSIMDWVLGQKKDINGKAAKKLRKICILVNTILLGLIL